MIGLIRRMLGLDCCGEWTRWEAKYNEYERVPGLYELLDSKHSVTSIVEVVRYQERRCTICGRIQQSRLMY